MDQFFVLLQSLFTYVWFVWKYFIHILLTYLQAAVHIFLHHAVLLICYWCNREFVGLAWMVRWEKFTHKTYDLKVLWNNQWYWMKYCCISVMFICMIVHQGHTPCISVRTFFFAFMKSIPFTHKFLSFVIDHNVCFERTQTWRNKNTLLGLQCLNSKATHPEWDQCNFSATLFCILQKVVSVHNVQGTT